MSDKTVAELMALHRVAVAAAVALDVADSFGSGSTKEQLEALRADAAGTHAALEQAIRRAVDWGEPKCWMAEIGSVSLPVGNPSRITIKAFYETQAEADVAADESDFDNIVTPLYARRTA